LNLKVFISKRKFENIYIGWGQKYIFNNFNPHLPDLPQTECTFDLNEQEDPSPLIEAQYQRQTEENKGEEEEEEEIEDDA
jgi:radial spoke head protein 4/6